MGLSTGYKVGVKREVLRAVENTLMSQAYPDEQLKGKLRPTLEYPLKEIQYPAVYITFSEGTLRNAGVGSYELDEENVRQVVKHWIFTGQINFNIMALTAEDRDMVASGIINMIAFSDNIAEFTPFRRYLSDAQYVAIQPIIDQITPMGDHVEQAPFGGEDDLVYGTGYSLAIFGDFYSDATNSATSGDLITISHINAYGYNLDPAGGQSIPHGTADPAPWT